MTHVKAHSHQTASSDSDGSCRGALLTVLPSASFPSIHACLDQCVARLQPSLGKPEVAGDGGPSSSDHSHSVCERGRGAMPHVFSSLAWLVHRRVPVASPKATGPHAFIALSNTCLTQCRPSINVDSSIERVMSIRGNLLYPTQVQKKKRVLFLTEEIERCAFKAGR